MCDLAAEIVPEQYAKLPLSRSSVHRYRRTNRIKLQESFKIPFEEDVPLILHFDTKQLPAKRRGHFIERLAVVITSGKNEFLLGIPTIPNGDAESISEAIFELITQFHLENQIVGLSCDNAPVNLGVYNGVCVRLEELLSKHLLHLPCRHHVFEIVIGTVFKNVFELKTKSPHVELFKDFNDVWDEIQHLPHSPCDNEILEGNDEIKRLKDEVIAFIFDVLQNNKKYIIRDDYKELLELCLMFFGETPPGGIKFHPPGACHRARWMSKIIYALKIYLFREHFCLTDEENAGLLEFLLFSTLIYIQHWITSTDALDSPINDLAFIEKLDFYKQISPFVAVTAINSFYEHLWYLGEELIVLSLLSENVPAHTKARMVAKMKSGAASFLRREHSLKYNPKKTKKSKMFTEKLNGRSLDSFVGRTSFFLFSLFDVDISFLDVPVESWINNAAYRNARDTFKNLAVVNDTAERAIKIGKDFNSIITDEENDKQLLFLNVFQNRKLLKNCNKSNFVR